MTNDKYSNLNEVYYYSICVQYKIQCNLGSWLNKLLGWTGWVWVLGCTTHCTHTHTHTHTHTTRTHTAHTHTTHTHTHLLGWLHFCSILWHGSDMEVRCHLKYAISKPVTISRIFFWYITLFWWYFLLFDARLTVLFHFSATYWKYFSVWLQKWLMALCQWLLRKLL